MNENIKLENGNVRTMEVRMSFPNFFEPTKPKEAPETQQKKYNGTFLFPLGADIRVLKAEAARVAKEKWGDNIPKSLKSPFKDQGDMLDREGNIREGCEAGAIFIRAASTTRPGVLGPDAVTHLEPADIYAGAYCKATLRAFTYGKVGSIILPGVSFGLQNVQKTRDGESLGGRTKAEDDFAPIDSESESGETTDASELF